jgi:hypothetical protein
MRGKKEPRAKYVALRSLSTAHEMTKPTTREETLILLDSQ